MSIPKKRKARMPHSTGLYPLVFASIAQAQTKRASVARTTAMISSPIQFKPCPPSGSPTTVSYGTGPQPGDRGLLHPQR